MITFYMEDRPVHVLRMDLTDERCADRLQDIENKLYSDDRFYGSCQAGGIPLMRGQYIVQVLNEKHAWVPAEDYYVVSASIRRMHYSDEFYYELEVSMPDEEELVVYHSKDCYAHITETKDIKLVL